MPYYSDEEDEIDIRFRRGGRASPAPIRYLDPIARERLERQERLDRAAYYQAATGARLLPNRSDSRHRSRSHTRRSQIPAGAPVIINNHVDNYYEEDIRVEEEPRYHYPQLVAAPVLTRPHRSHSRRRSRSSSSSSRERYELEHTRRELEKLRMKEMEDKERKEKAEAERKAVEEWKRREDKEKKERAEAEKKAIEEWKRREEKEKKDRAEAEKRAVEEWKRKEDEKKKEKAEAEKKAVEEWKRKEEEKKEKEKKQKEEEDKKYKEKVEADMRKAGLSDHQIAAVLKKDKDKQQQLVVPDRPTYTRMARRHISIETLRTHHIDFEFDVDPEFVIIKRWVPEYEQDFLWSHTRQIREVRGGGHHHHHQQQLLPPPPPAGGVLLVEDAPRRRHSREEDRLEFVRRKHSPHPWITYFAGGSRR